MELRLEAITLPVTDVDRAKAFYERAGFALDVDASQGETFRVVQLTPPGSPASVLFGTGLGTTPSGPVTGLYLVVDDLAAAVADLAARGIEVDPPRHMTADGWQPGVDPEHADYNSFSGFTDPDGNGWLLQERGHAR